MKLVRLMMSTLSGLEQKIKQKEKKSRRGLGWEGKLAIAGGVVMGATYLGFRKVKKMFYPPSGKKFLALATAFVFFMGIRYSAPIAREIGGFYSGIKRVEARRLDHTAEIEYLREENKEYEKKNMILRYQNKAKQKALDESKRYILGLEEECFNTATTLKTNKIKIRKPPRAAFEDYLLHDRDYNGIILKIDKALKDDYKLSEWDKIKMDSLK